MEGLLIMNKQISDVGTILLGTIQRFEIYFQSFSTIIFLTKTWKYNCMLLVIYVKKKISLKQTNLNAVTILNFFSR